MQKIIGLVLWGLACLVLSASAGAVTTSFTVSGTWTAPAGVTSVTVEAWGAGGGGGAATGSPAKGGGGAGGQYAKKVVAVVPGTVYAIAVGAGGTVGTAVAGGIGGNSTFAATTVVAKGGAGGGLAAANNSGGTAGAGSVAGGVGDIVYAGGNGSAAAGAVGGAGGGGAGSAGAGGNAVGNTAGAGTATGGGAGGAGLTARGAGAAGVVAGGGGGGGYATSTTDRSGGLGAAGAVNISYVSSGPVAVTYYHDTTTGVAIGFDGPTNVLSGTKVTIPPIITASLIATSACAGNARSANHPVGSYTHSRWYLTTNYAVATNIGANPTGSASIRGQAATNTVIVRLYDYEPLLGGKTLIGSSPAITLTGAGTTTTYAYTIGSPVYTVAAGHRLMLEYQFNQPLATDNARIYCSATASFISVTEAPASAPLACFTDAFTGADNAVPGANWSASSNSGTFGAPRIFNTAGNGRLRLTDATLNVATFAALQQQFPGAGNKIVVEFDHFAYGGTGADGIAVVLSDAAVLPAPGGYGGSLGYANRSTPAVVDGFSGGWLGVGLDEYGNFSNPIEGRSGGPGLMLDSVSVRGSGSAQTGYAFHTGTATLNPQVDNNGAAVPPHRYRITIDHTNGVNAWVTVERNTGAGYVLLIPAYDAKIKAGQAAVPANWLLSITGSTGASTNIHEIDNLSVCTTQAIAPYTPPAAAPGDFNIFDTTTAAGAKDGLIQTKVAGKSFTLDIAVLNIAKTAYLTTLAGAVKVELLNSSNNTGVLDNATGCMSTWSLLQALPNATFPAAPNSGRVTTAAITVPDAWADVRVRVSYPATGTPTKIGCSTDNFSIRPDSLASLAVKDANWTTAGTSNVLNNTVATGGALHKAGQPFTVQATAVNAAAATTSNYAGTPNPLLTVCAGTACTATFGTFSIGTGAAMAGLINSSTATYSEVGSFALQLQDKSFAAVDLNNPLDLTPKDCTGGWICSSTVNVGRFVPDHFDVTFNTPTFTPAIVNLSAPDSFTYIGQAFGFDPGFEPVIKIRAMGAGLNVTGNYTGVLWKLTSSFVTSQLWADVSTVSCPSCLPLVVNDNQALAVPIVADTLGGYGTVTFDVINGLKYVRPAVPVVPFNAALRLSGGLGVDGDGVAAYVAGAPVTTYQFASVKFSDANPLSINDAQMRYGRMSISNAYGSELLPQTLTAMAQYCNAVSGATCSDWRNSSADSSSNFVVATPLAISDVSFGNYQKNLTAVSVAGTPNTVMLVNGVGSFTIVAPGASGSVDVTIPVLTGMACNVAPTPFGCYMPSDPARATFGVYVGNSVFIYRGRHGR